MKKHRWMGYQLRGTSPSIASISPPRFSMSLFIVAPSSAKKRTGQSLSEGSGRLLLGTFFSTTSHAASQPLSLRRSRERTVRVITIAGVLVYHKAAARISTLSKLKASPGSFNILLPQTLGPLRRLMRWTSYANAVLQNGERLGNTFLQSK